jgi:hypothetical protein
VSEVNKFSDEQGKLNMAIREKESEIETANADLQ